MNFLYCATLSFKRLISVSLIHWSWATSELWWITYQCMQFGIYMLMTINIKALGCWLRHYLYSVCEWPFQWWDSFLKQTCLVRKLQSTEKAVVKLWLGSILIKPEKWCVGFTPISNSKVFCPMHKICRARTLFSQIAFSVWPFSVKTLQMLLSYWFLVH